MPWTVSNLDQPHKPDKGKRGGSCNRHACQAPGANYWNRGSYAWYCESCALDINRANRDFIRNGKYAPLCVHESVIDADPSEMDYGA